MNRKKVIFDMETADPDDVMTLLFLTSHKLIDLLAVTISPGSFEQVGLVKHVLSLVGYDYNVPVGGQLHPYKKECVSHFHYKWFPEAKTRSVQPDDDASELLHKTIASNPDTVLLTGAPLKNVSKAFSSHPDLELQEWVAQGGFAGDNIVAEEHRLDKFKGMVTCPTFNFNGDPNGAKFLLETEQIKKIYCISKNVCHGLAYDKQMHEAVEPHHEKSRGLFYIYKGMEIYLKKKPQGKLFHDPLAAATIANKDICEYKEVELYRERGKWGSRVKEDTNTFISVSVNRDKFIDTLVN